MTEKRSELEQRVQDLEILTGFQERTLASLQAEVLAFTRRVTQLEAELQRVKSTRSEEPFDENDRVPSGG
jgi:uncharacterized coiled-coil protein SlyX